jgi:hypothetical protein
MVHIAPGLGVEFDCHSRRLTGEFEEPKRPVPQSVNAIVVVGSRPGTKLRERGDDNLVAILCVTLVVVCTPLESVESAKRVPERVVNSTVGVDAAEGRDFTVAKIPCYPALVAAVVCEGRAVEDDASDSATERWQELFRGRMPDSLVGVRPVRASSILRVLSFARRQHQPADDQAVPVQQR